MDFEALFKHWRHTLSKKVIQNVKKKFKNSLQRYFCDMYDVTPVILLMDPSVLCDLI